MDQEMIKSLTSLIDETISEIEDLKKSRYSAAEAKIGDDDSGVARAKKDGKIEKEECDDDDAEKAEGKNAEADPGSRGPVAPSEASDPAKSNLHEEAAKADDEDEDEEEEDEKDKKKMDKAEGKNAEADPGSRGPVAPSEAAAPQKSNLEEEAKKSEQPAEGYEIKKSLEAHEELFKSYDEKFESLEKKLSSIMDAVKEMAEEPAPRKGVPSGAVPLKKSADEEEGLSKSQAIGKLLELKKSGTYVDTADIAAVEMGGDFQAIVEKYSLN